MIYLKVIIKVKYLYSKFRFWLTLESTKTFYLSLGENCLTDYILSSHGLKVFSTIYSNGRSNIDYAFLEKNNYSGLLSFENLKYDVLNDKKVVRSTMVVECQNIYQVLQMNGFEFTHHDVIKNEFDRESYRRKIERQLKYRKKKNFIFLYHHRINENSDFTLLFEKLLEYSKFYNTKKHFCKIIVFTQNIVNDNNDRKITYDMINDTVHFFNLSTLKNWDGDGDDFWAKNDEDLIDKLIHQIKLIQK
ncbi:MAG: DUF1796 family putative cysteine peptidase [Flavobacterium sp.]